MGQALFRALGRAGGNRSQALFPFDLNIWYGAIAQNVTVDDWADDNFDHSGLGFIGGATHAVNTEKHPIGAAAMNTYGRAPQWGSKWKAFVRENAGRWVSSYMQANTFPYENTYLDLDPDVKDPLGDPVCRDHQRAERERAEAGFVRRTKNGRVVSGRRRHRSRPGRKAAPARH